MTAKRHTRITTSILVSAAGVAAAAAALTSARGAPVKPQLNGAAASEAPPGAVLAVAPKEPPALQGPDVAPERPLIDVVFVLDTTGSMAGLINGAKSKIWSLANEISSGQPRPIVRFGLIGYRDKGDAYVTRVAPLTTDMDDLYETLMKFRADGGGDAPEHVNRALYDALTKMAWHQGQNVLKLVFLVGDAPPHDDYRDVPTSRQLARRARDMGIAINAIQCGHAHDTEASFRSIARIAGGDFASIAQDGGMLAVRSPYDDELERLNRELATTGVGYGSSAKRAKLSKKMAARMAMKSEVAAAAASYSARAGAGALGEGDLIADVKAGRVAVDTLSDDELPPAMRGLSNADKHRYLAERADQREQVRNKILQVSKQREQWLERQRRAAGRKADDGFDGKVMGSVKAKAAEVGVAW
jgi:Mg-chelatase subunit ChlD